MPEESLHKLDKRLRTRLTELKEMPMTDAVRKETSKVLGKCTGLLPKNFNSVTL